jgi:hypothetical protein
MKHLVEKQLTCPSQQGFMPGKSCASNLAVLLRKATEAVDEGKSIEIVYKDFATAFYKVPIKRWKLS